MAGAEVVGEVVGGGGDELNAGVSGEVGAGAVAGGVGIVDGEDALVAGEVAVTSGSVLCYSLQHNLYLPQG